jgi:hypothetical protein
MGGALLVVLGLLGWLATLATGDRNGPLGTVGYTVQPPAGWTDITRNVTRRTGVAFDVAYGGPTLDGVQVNVNVARSDARQGASLAEVVQDGRVELERLGRGALDLTRPVPTRVDGEAGLRYDFTARRTAVRQVGLVRDGTYYVVTLTAARSAFRRALPRLDDVLRSWRWD